MESGAIKKGEMLPLEKWIVWGNATTEKYETSVWEELPH